MAGLINFKVTKAEAVTIGRIVRRAAAFHPDDAMTISMDVTACHANGCPLDLEKLLDAPDFDFAHDVMGIRRHIDRKTGKLGGCFVPRCAADQEERAEQERDRREIAEALRGPASVEAGIKVVDKLLGGPR